MAGGWETDEELAGWRSDFEDTLKEAYTLYTLTTDGTTGLKREPWVSGETGYCNVVSPGSITNPQFGTIFRDVQARTQADRVIELKWGSIADKGHKITVGTHTYIVVEMQPDDTYAIGRLAYAQMKS